MTRRPAPHPLPRLALPLILFALCGALCLSPRPSSAAEGETCAIAMDPLNVNRFPRVSFLGQVTLRNVPVKGLAARDFALDEDGKTVDAFTVTVAADPASIALVIDGSGSIKEFAQVIRDGACAFVDAMKESDRALVVRFNRDVVLMQALTESRDALKNAIARLHPDGGTKLYDGLHRGLSELSGAKKYLVLFTDGRDERQAGDAARYSAHSLDEVLALAKERSIAIFVIGTGRDIDATTLGRLAKETGGAFLHAMDANRIVQAYEDVASLLSHRYRFEYASPVPVADGRERTVTLARTDRSAKASRTYRISPETVLRDPERRGGAGAATTGADKDGKGATGRDGAPGGARGSADLAMGTEEIRGADGVAGHTIQGPEAFSAGSTEGFFVPDGKGGQTYIPGVRAIEVPAVPDTVIPAVPGTPDFAIPTVDGVKTEFDVDPPTPPEPAEPDTGDDASPADPEPDEPEPAEEPTGSDDTESGTDE